MVLEGLINPFKAEKRPFEMFFLGIILSSVAIILSIYVFSPFSSIVAISLTAIVCVPLICGVLKIEERKTIEIRKESVLFREHGRALLFFLYLFLGFIASFALWYSFLPEAYVSELFSVQRLTIYGTIDDFTGHAVSSGSSVVSLFAHNVKVLAFCLLFAFFYGFGAVFILTWNASVLGTVIGESITSNLGTGVFSAVSSGMMQYLVHGIPEMLAYFTAGLAGGIISIAVVNHEFQPAKFKKVIKDSVGLIIASASVLLLAALLEVHVSPFV